MKYLFITNQFMTGGVERVFLNIASNINNSKILIVPIHPIYDSNLIKQLPQNVTFVKTDKIKRNKIFAFINLFKIANYINSKLTNDFEQICCINFSDTISTIIVSCLIKANTHISWCHCNPNAYKKSKFFFLYKLFFNKFDKIICLCNSQKIEFSNIFNNIMEEKIQICFNLTDLNLIDSLKLEPLEFKNDFILMVARFDKRSKDFITLIDAYKDLNSELKQKYKLVLVGDGPDFDEIKRYSKKTGEESNIFFAGKQANPYKWMYNAKLFVLSSKTEGFPLVICEALACDCPVISSDCISGPKDILENGKYGLLYNVGDSKKLTEELTLLLTNQSKYYELKVLSRQRVLQINSNSMTDLNKIFSNEVY